MNDDVPSAQAIVPELALSIYRLAATSDEQVLAALAAAALAAGHVHPSFADALLARERSHPTGLPTVVPVAIPHADVEHVIRPGLGIALLEQPVSFGEMGSGGSSVQARVVVLILVTEPHAQVELLVSLIDVFQREGWFERLDSTSDTSELVHAFGALLRAEASLEEASTDVASTQAASTQAASTDVASTHRNET